MLICLSPQYKEDADASIFENEDAKTVKDIQKNQQRCCVRYLYRMMQADYANNGCINTRYRPVMFPSTKYDTKYIPTWLKNTTRYKWPDDGLELCEHLAQQNTQGSAKYSKNGSVRCVSTSVDRSEVKKPVMIVRRISISSANSSSID